MKVVDFYKNDDKLFIDFDPSSLLGSGDTELLKLFVLDGESGPKSIKLIDFNVKKRIERVLYQSSSGISLGEISIVRERGFAPACFVVMEDCLLNWRDFFEHENLRQLGEPDEFIGSPVTTQMCFMFKNEWDRVPYILDFYRRIHGIERFVLYDNNSDVHNPESYRADDVIIRKWPLSYISNVWPGYEGESGFLLNAQNSAYSNCLKKYRNSEWTLFFDLDELLVCEDSFELSRYLSECEYSSVKFNGYWVGCNSMGQQEYFRHLDLITRRSDKRCGGKLALRSGAHWFTRAVHWAYPSMDRSFRLSTLEMNEAYFFHLRSASPKNRKCDCGVYCKITDLSLQNIQSRRRYCL